MITHLICVCLWGFFICGVFISSLCTFHGMSSRENSWKPILSLNVFMEWFLSLDDSCFFLWMIHGREYPEFECFHGRLEVGDGIGNPPTLQLLLRSRSLRLSNSHPDKSFSWLFNIGGLRLKSWIVLLKITCSYSQSIQYQLLFFPLFDLRFVQETKLYWPL